MADVWMPQVDGEVRYFDLAVRPSLEKFFAGVSGLKKRWRPQEVWHHKYSVSAAG